ncbi:hypothetical protein GALL_456000 [mine drainage metagenome]|uniref:DSP-PTPase phosphatase fused to NAD+ Kinase domain-containing protein n=1 Tax=mine drainage metagenome TaxID=410659 RepID=A0A1J5Q5N3_9ZZZZ
MFKTLHRRVKDLERRLNIPTGRDLSDPEDRRRATWHFHLMDHAFLRVLWTNFYPVTDGVYRSNQPSPQRLHRYAKLGIKTVLNLRGNTPLSYYLFEKEACAKLGMELIDIKFAARSLPTPESLIALEQVFRTIPKPFVMHCKSGADRAGFASALYLMMIEGRPVDEAARQLHWRFIHLKSTDTGVLDHFLRFYAREHARSGIALMDWVRNGYDRDEVTRSFRDWQAGKWSAQP